MTEPLKETVCEALKSPGLLKIMKTLVQKNKSLVDRILYLSENPPIILNFSVDIKDSAFKVQISDNVELGDKYVLQITGLHFNFDTSHVFDYSLSCDFIEENTVVKNSNNKKELILMRRGIGLNLTYIRPQKFDTICPLPKNLRFDFKTSSEIPPDGVITLLFSLTDKI